ncbi:MAG: alpha/beta hydrolase [Candidatus Latescibacteria bacterium]|nr:alpha/beta hydrolase [Candidatus Latescibacterota bacterium]
MPRPRTLVLDPYVVEGVAETLLAGKLSVPEDRSKPKGRTITLHIVVVPALTNGIKDAPLFDLAGGPGLPASGAASWYAADSTGYRATRDIILVDQRGTGQSNPLRCPELETVSKLARMYDPAAVRRCRDELAKDADLSQYGTLQAVHDLEAVRVALGFETIDLMGLSYGTVVAQVYMREYPHNVRCAVLTGTVPIDEKLPLHHARGAEDVLQNVLDDCEFDPLCDQAFPSLRGEWRDLLASFDAGPVNAIYHDSLDTRLVALERGPFCEGLRTLLMTTPVQRRLPYILHRAAEGDFFPFFSLVSPDSGEASPFAEGMYLCVTCPEGTQRITSDEIEIETAGTFLGRYRVDEQVGACNEWGLPPLSDEALAPVSASIPTLLLAGGMDYVTPVEWAQHVSSRLTDSRVVVIDYLGHYPDGMANMGCLDELIRAFLRAGTTVDLDISCVDTMTPPPFALE